MVLIACIDQSDASIIRNIGCTQDTTASDTSLGALRVHDVSSRLWTEHREDDAHTTLDYGQQTLGVRSNTLASLCGTDGDYAPFQINDIGAMYVTGEHREDDQHTTLDYGHAVWSVRNDLLASLCSTDGDYTPFQVNDIGALFVTGEHREDDAHVSLDYGHQVLAVRNDTLASLCDTDGDYAPFQVDANGALFTATAGQADLETTHHTTASATAAGSVADVDGYTMALVHEVEDTGGWDRTGTYTIQVSPDSGTTYKNADIYDVENGRALAGAALTIVSSDNRSFLVDLRGMDKLRVNLSVTVAGTTGTVTITSRAIPITNSILGEMAQGTDGAAVPPAVIAVAGSDGTNLEALHVAVDNATATATPNVLIGGGIYKATLDTYADNDAVPFHFDVGGRLYVNTEIQGNAPQAHGIDAAGADAYTTVVTAGAERHHISISLQGANDAIVSLDSGTTDHFYIPANSAHVFDDIVIANSATVQGKNASAGNNYTNLAISVW